MKVFIDGSAGTTGLEILGRLEAYRGVELIRLSEERRKLPEARCEAINASDVTFLCLPDAAAEEAAAMADNPHTAIIDTSTAHRVAEGWTYGLPELPGRRALIRASRRVANPGCHATGFIALVAPLVEAGLLAADTPLTCFSLTGYSGGGKKMIAQYQDEGRPALYEAPRQYGLTQTHKHLKEMQVLCALTRAPVFCPIVADYYRGMEVTVPLFSDQIRGGADQVRAVYRELYRGPVVRYTESAGEEGFMSASAFAGRDDMEISVAGNDERLLLIARFDNLGKGASGAAIQNMNIILGLDETTGLHLES